MKKITLLSTFLAIFVCAPSAFATWTVGNHGGAYGVGSPGSLSLDTTGSAVVLMETIHGSTCTATPADGHNSNAVWVLIGTVTTPVFGDEADLYIIGGAGFQTGAYTYTTTGTCTSSTLIVFGLNNATTTTADSIVDSVTASNTGASGTSLQGGSITPTANNSIVVSFAAIDGASITVNGGFTAEVINAGAGNYAGGVAVLVQTNSTPANPTWSWASSGESGVYNLDLLDKLPLSISCGGASPNWTANSWSSLNDCFSKATTPADTITITANLSATSPLTWSVPADARLLGQGNLSVIGGGDVTTITDNYPGSNFLLTLDLSNTGYFRMAGITLAGGPASNVLNHHEWVIALSGPGSARIDHMHFNMQSFDFTNGQFSPLYIGDRVYGVMDHSILDVKGLSGIYIFNGGGGDNGNTAWAADTAFGGPDFWFNENNTWNGNIAGVGSRVSDCFSAGRVVNRYNTLGYTAGPEVHATGHAGNDRGCRAEETYKNHFVRLPGQTSVAYEIHDASSGPAIIWGNVADTNTLKNGYTLFVTRTTDSTYGQNPPPDAWGYCGPGYHTGTATVSGTTVTATSGTFSTSWQAGLMIFVNGTAFHIASVTNTTHLELTASGATNGAWITGSPWDGNSNDTNGYPCLDQPGRGKGDLLTGDFPNKVNSTSGMKAWPNQALEPVYVVADTFTPASGEGGATYNLVTQTVVDRDIYEQASGPNTNSLTPFDGTTGTGWGTRAHRPANCTTGVMYLSVDQGSWNATNAGMALTVDGVNYYNGVFDKCTSTNVWNSGNDSVPFYTPYTYPHPFDINLSLVSLNPSSGAENSGPTSVTLTGSSLSGTTCSVAVSGTGVSTSNCVVVNSTTITADFAIAANATVGAHNVTVTVDGNISNTVTFTVTCTSASVGFSTQPTSAFLNQTIGTVAVNILCGDGTLNSASSANITLSKGAGATWGTLTSASSLTKAASSGNATWTTPDLVIVATAGSGFITASSSGLTSGNSNSITITVVPSGGVSGGGRTRVRKRPIGR